MLKNLNIPQYEDHSVTTDNIDDRILRAKESHWVGGSVSKWSVVSWSVGRWVGSSWI